MAEYRRLLFQLLDMERRLEELGNVTIDTNQGPYAASEGAIADDVPAQRAYNGLKARADELRKVVDAYERVARYRAASMEREEQDMADALLALRDEAT